MRVAPDGSGGDFVVCDGMGGAAAGELASGIAAETMLRGMASGPLSAERMRQAVRAANASVYSRSELDPALEGMGTTLVSLALSGVRGWVAHVGDSRCYRLREAGLERLTQDHSLVEEQVRQGRLTPAEAAVSPLRNIITRAVGTSGEVVADIAEIDVLPRDLYLLTSDGLTREVSEEQIAEILRAAKRPEQMCLALIDAANRAGGRDNITCILVRVL